MALTAKLAACAGTIQATPQHCAGASAGRQTPAAWNNPTAFPEHARPPQLSGTGDLPGCPRSEAESREGAVIASTKLWGASSCCPVPPRRALRPSSSPQGLCLYLAKPGKVGGAPELGLRWTVT